MPKYRVTSPDGRTFDVDAPEGATQEDAIAYVQQNYFSNEDTRKKTNVLEDVGSRLFDTTQDILVRGPAFAAGGVAGLVSDLTGSEDAGALRDIYFDSVRDITRQRQEREAQLNRGEGGKVAGALATIPFYLTPAGAGAMIGTGGMDTSINLVNEGASSEQALAGAGFDMASASAMYALGPLTNVTGRLANAGVQAGINVAQEAGINRPMQNVIRENADLQRLPEMGWGDYGAAAVPGAVFGALSPKKGAQKETPLPDTTPPVDVDAAYVARKEATLRSIEAQVYILEQKISSITPREDGTYSEKQFNLIKDLEKQKEAKQEEAATIQRNLAAYKEPSQVEKIEALSTEDILGTTATTNKQRGSWTPFEEMVPEERPDDSNAPGAMPVKPEKRFGFKKFVTEKVDPDFQHPSRRQPTPPLDEGLTLREWETKYSEDIDPFGDPPKDSRELAIYNQKRVELEQAGILDTPIGAEDDVRYRQRGFKTREKANNYVKMLEGQVESQKKLVKRLEENLDTPVGSQIDLDNARARLEQMQTRLGNYRSKDMGWKEDRVSKPQISETFSLDDDANKTPEQVKQERIDAGLDPLPPAPRGPGFKQRGAVDLFLSTEKAKNNDAVAIASRLKQGNFDRVVDVTNLRSPEEMWTEMKEPNVKDYGGFLTRGERAMFGFQQFVEAIKRKAPLVWEQAKRIRQAENAEVEMKRLIWHGSNTEGFSGIGPFRKLKHTQNPDTMETLLPTLSTNDKIVLTEFLVNNSENRVRHIKADMSGLTDLQKRAVTIIQRFYDQIQRVSGTNYRNGYVHAVRKGNFGVGIRTSRGDLFHIEDAPTMEIAEKMRTFLNEKGYNTTDIIDFKADPDAPLSDSFNTVKGVMEDLKDRLPDTDTGQALRALDDLQNWMAEHATPGKHNVRANLFTGYKGTSLIKGRKQNAEDFFNGFKGYLDEIAAQRKKNQLTELTTEFWENDFGRKLQEQFPNQYDTAMYLNDVAMNKNQTYETIKKFDDKARQVIDDFVSRQVRAIDKNLAERGLKKEHNPFYYPEVPLLDRGIGLAAQLFYIRTLTSRPAFWAGQILSSPFSVRQFLKEGSVLDTLAAQGKAWGTLMTGGDKEFRAFYNDIRQSRDTIRPQFIVDINRVPIVEDAEHPTLNKAFMWGTGQEQAGIADSASRYFTLAMAYHFYKDQGLSGSKLKENAVALTELTMQMYNRANSPPVLNKMGIIGTNIAPLQKYGIGQLSNLIGDLRYMMQQPGFAGKLKGSLPALSTLMVTMIMGGTTGIALLTEYEALRYIIVKSLEAIGKEDWADMFPSAIENMMKHQNWLQQGVQKTYEGLGASEEFAKSASTHGIPSAATGFDIGSSLRYNPYVGEAIIKQNYSPIDNFPIVKQIVDMASVGMVKGRKILGGDVDTAEERKADLSMQVLTGQNYLIDKFKYGSDTRPFVPGGGRGYAQVPQTKKEQIGQIIGSPSLETAKERKVVELMDRDEKRIAQKRQDAMDLAADGYLEDDQKKIDRGIKLALDTGMSDKQIRKSVKALVIQRHKTRLDAMTTNRRGIPSSTEQKRKYMERLEYE